MSLDDFDENDDSRASVVEYETDPEEGGIRFDGLADPFTADEQFRAEVSDLRTDGDIQPSDFSEYEGCIEETLQGPDEIWSFNPDEEAHSQKLYHFLRDYSDTEESMWYVIIARETDDDEHLEIVDAFPTRDLTMVDHFRRGSQELGDDPWSLWLG